MLPSVIPGSPAPSHPVSDRAHIPEARVCFHTSSMKKRDTHIHTPTHSFYLGQSTLKQKHKQTYKYCFVFVFTRNWLIIGVLLCHRTELNSYLGLKHFSKGRVCRDAPLLPHCKDDLSIHAQASLAYSSHKASEPGTPEEGLCRTHITKDL